MKRKAQVPKKHSTKLMSSPIHNVTGRESKFQSQASKEKSTTATAPMNTNVIEHSSHQDTIEQLPSQTPNSVLFPSSVFSSLLNESSNIRFGSSVETTFASRLQVEQTIDSTSKETCSSHLQATEAFDSADSPPITVDPRTSDGTALSEATINPETLHYSESANETSSSSTASIMQKLRKESLDARMELVSVKAERDALRAQLSQVYEESAAAQRRIKEAWQAMEQEKAVRLKAQAQIEVGWQKREEAWNDRLRQWEQAQKNILNEHFAYFLQQLSPSILAIEPPSSESRSITGEAPLKETPESVKTQTCTILTDLVRYMNEYVEFYSSVDRDQASYKSASDELLAVLQDASKQLVMCRDSNAVVEKEEEAPLPAASGEVRLASSLRLLLLQVIPLLSSSSHLSAQAHSTEASPAINDMVFTPRRENAEHAVTPSKDKSTAEEPRSSALPLSSESINELLCSGILLLWQVYKGIEQDVNDLVTQRRWLLSSLGYPYNRRPFLSLQSNPRRTDTLDERLMETHNCYPHPETSPILWWRIRVVMILAVFRLKRLSIQSARQCVRLQKSLNSGNGGDKGLMHPGCWARIRLPQMSVLQNSRNGRKLSSVIDNVALPVEEVLTLVRSALQKAFSKADEKELQADPLLRSGKLASSLIMGLEGLTDFKESQLTQEEELGKPTATKSLAVCLRVGLERHLRDIGLFSDPEGFPSTLLPISRKNDSSDTGSDLFASLVEELDVSGSDELSDVFAQEVLCAVRHLNHRVEAALNRHQTHSSSSSVIHNHVGVSVEK